MMPHSLDLIVFIVHTQLHGWPYNNFCVDTNISLISDLSQKSSFFLDGFVLNGAVPYPFSTTQDVLSEKRTELDVPSLHTLYHEK